MPEELEIKCMSCGDKFKTTRAWSKFCSTKCRNNFHNDKKYMDKGEIPSIKCPNCNTDDHKMFELMWPNHYLCNVCAKEFEV